MVNSGEGITIPKDTVLEELRNIAFQMKEKTESLAMAMAVYMLGFHTYHGFKDYLKEEDMREEATLKRLYEYAKVMR